MPHKGLLDHREVRIIVLGRRIQDLADGTYFTCQQTSDDAVAEEGVGGAVVITKTGAQLWEATVSIMASSQRFNSFLWLIRKAWVEAPGGIPIPFALSHKGTELITSSAIIRRPPAVSYARTSAGTRDWTFLLPGYDGSLGGFELDTEAPVPDSIYAALAPA